MALQGDGTLAVDSRPSQAALTLWKFEPPRRRDGQGQPRGPRPHPAGAEENRQGLLLPDREGSGAAGSSVSGLHPPRRGRGGEGRAARRHPRGHGLRAGRELPLRRRQLPGHPAASPLREGLFHQGARGDLRRVPGVLAFLGQPGAQEPLRRGALAQRPGQRLPPGVGRRRCLPQARRGQLAGGRAFVGGRRGLLRLAGEAPGRGGPPPPPPSSGRRPPGASTGVATSGATATTPPSPSSTRTPRPGRSSGFGRPPVPFRSTAASTGPWTWPGMSGSGPTASCPAAAPSRRSRGPAPPPRGGSSPAPVPATTLSSPPTSASDMLFRSKAPLDIDMPPWRGYNLGITA